MDRSILRCFALGMLVLTSTTFAQNGGLAADRGTLDENIIYAYAQVMRVDPVYRVVERQSGQHCDNRRRQGDGGDPTGGTVLGAIIGGALGHQVGKGDGRKAATIAGAVAGGAIGRHVDKHDGSDPQGQGECNASGFYQARQVVGYDVEYQYKGDRYVSRLPYDPGNRMRIRISIAPDIQPYGSH